MAQPRRSKWKEINERSLYRGMQVSSKWETAKHAGTDSLGAVPIPTPHSNPLNRWFLNRGDFVPQETAGNV